MKQGKRILKGRLMRDFGVIMALFAGLIMGSQSLAGQSRGGAGLAPQNGGEDAGVSIADQAVSHLELISAQTAIGQKPQTDDNARVLAGLWLRLDPGWKTYWRSPGDAGYPMNIDWSGSDNLHSATLFWPAPRRYSAYGLETIGYENEVVFPVQFEVADASLPLFVQAVVSYLVCEEICIPIRNTVSLSIPPGAAAPTQDATLIAHYQAALPVKKGAELPHITINQLANDEAKKDLKLRAEVRASQALQTPDLFLEAVGIVDTMQSSEATEIPEIVETIDGIWVSIPMMELHEGGKRAVFEMTAGGVPSLIGVDVRATLVDGNKAWEVPVTVVASPEAASPGGGAGLEGVPPWGVILGLAFLGGLILNLMPCVLPVLSLKILAVLRSSEGISPRLQFLSTAAGIMTSFLFLATILVFLQAGGHRIGWGVQFQQPIFLAVMAVIITLFACNLWGWFPVSAPRFLVDRLPVSVGKEEMLGHFATGAFATMLATPCSAPFLGTAVGFALSGQSEDIFLIFAVLGMGFSTPYLLLALFPSMVVWLPRPGHWMVIMKYSLGFFLLGTALWLLTIIMAQRGDIVALMVFLLLSGLMGGLAWSAFAAKIPSQAPQWSRHRATGRYMAIVCGVAAIMVSPGMGAQTGEARLVETADSAHWNPLNREWIDRHVSDGHVVLVDVTADWCLTCQVNKYRVLDQPPVSDLLQEGDILGVRADWTRPDRVIAEYLAAYGRYGIPFNQIYGPGAREGILLPEFLMTEDVLAAIAQARLLPRGES